MELRESKSRYQDLFDQAPDLFVAIDARSGAVVDCNQTALDTLRFTRSELLGRGVVSLYHPCSQGEAERLVEQFLATGTLEPNDLRLQRKDGTCLDVSLRVSAERDTPGDVVRCRMVWRDITERRRVEEAVRQSQKLESLGVRASGIAHDFNNLLVGILGNAQLMIDEVGPAGHLRERLDEIVQASSHAAELTRQLLAYAGSGKVREEPLDLNRVVRGMSELLRRGVAKEVAFVFELDEAGPVVVGGPAQVRQVVMNLARPRGDPGHPRGAPRDPARRQRPGAGVDLPGPAPARRRGRAGRGAIPEPPGAPTRFGPRGRRRAHGPRRPLADADAHGMRVWKAQGGDRAVALAREHADDIDAVVLDVTMPGMSGRATCDALREVRADLPILFCSGESAENCAEMLQGAPRTGFLPKPFGLDELRDRLAELPRPA